MRRFPAVEKLCEKSIFSSVRFELVDERETRQIEECNQRSASSGLISQYLLRSKDFRACCASFEYSFLKEVDRFQSFRRYWTRVLIIGCSANPDPSFVEFDSEYVYVEVKASADEIIAMGKRERIEQLYEITKQALRKVGDSLGIRFRKMAKILKRMKPRLGAWKRNHQLRYTDNVLCGSFNPANGAFSETDIVSLAMDLAEIGEMRDLLGGCVEEAEDRMAAHEGDGEPIEVSLSLGEATFRFVIVSDEEIGSKVTWNAGR